MRNRIDYWLWGVNLFLQAMLLLGFVLVGNSDALISLTKQADKMSVNALESEIESGRRALSAPEQVRLVREGRYLLQTASQSAVALKSYVLTMAQTLVGCIVIQIVLLVRLVRRKSIPGDEQSQ